MPLETFSCPQFESNLDYIMKHTHLSMSDKIDPANADPGTMMNRLESGCTVDIRMSNFLTPTHVVGAAKIEQADEEDGDGITEPGLLPNERAAFATGASMAAKRFLATNNLPSEEQVGMTLTRIHMGRYDPLSTLSVMLEVQDNIQFFNKYALFQCTVRYLDVDQQCLVTRVVTQRLPVAKNVQDFLDGMDEEVVPVVLGREAVFRSCVGREEQEAIDAIVADTDRVEALAIEAQKDLDNTINRVSGAFRLMNLEEGPTRHNLMEEGGVAAANSSLDFAFPPELADALHRLFHLRRGSMLSPGPVRSIDDRAEIRNLYLRLPLDDCLCMMAPSLWSSKILGVSTEISNGLEAVPSDTLALWDNVSKKQEAIDRVKRSAVDLTYCVCYSGLLQRITTTVYLFGLAEQRKTRLTTESANNALTF